MSSMFCDRRLETRLNALSELSCKEGSGQMCGRVLKIDADGCDQAKFRVPRNLASSKEFEHLWRPQLHLTGIIAWGVRILFQHGV